MEKRKWFILKCFLEQKPELTLKDYFKEIKSVEPEARSFYLDVEMESETFVRMLLLDSLIILALFCGMPGYQEGRKQRNKDMDDSVSQINECVGTGHDNDNTSQMVARADELYDESRSGENYMDPPGWFWTFFAHDLFLLENQLPLFILQKIHDLVYGGSQTQLIDIMKGKVGMFLSDYTKLDSEKVITQNMEVHLLHLCHLFFRPALQQESAAWQLLESSQMFRLGNAGQLYEAGVNFEARCSSTQHCLLDITFDSTGKLAMPCLPVDDNTHSLLRNLIALEQMKYPSMGLNVSAYAVLLLHLITIPEDVQLLRRKGIIQHHLASDKEMMYLVNRLGVGLSFDYVEDEYNLKPVFQELRIYTERRTFPRWRVWLKHRYFRNPWTVISLLAASLLILSSLQTYYSVYSYYQPCLNVKS